MLFKVLMCFLVVLIFVDAKDVGLHVSHLHGLHERDITLNATLNNVNLTKLLERVEKLEAGVTLNTICDSSPCLDGTLCFSSGTMYTCVDVCASNPCGNGVCQPVGLDDYVCDICEINHPGSVVTSCTVGNNHDLCPAGSICVCCYLASTASMWNDYHSRGFDTSTSEKVMVTSDGSSNYYMWSTNAYNGNIYFSTVQGDGVVQSRYWNIGLMKDTNVASAQSTPNDVRPSWNGDAAYDNQPGGQVYLSNTGYGNYGAQMPAGSTINIMRIDGSFIFDYDANTIAPAWGSLYTGAYHLTLGVHNAADTYAVTEVGVTIAIEV